MRAAVALLILALAAAGDASARASDPPRPKRRQPPAVAPAPAPAPRASPIPVPPGRLTLGGLAGLRSPGDGGTSCRTGCARVRYACEVQEDGCATPWAACVRACGDAGASR